VGTRGSSDITAEELEWLKKYAQSVVYMARKRIDNPFRPGSEVYSVEPDGIGAYGKIYNSDYYHAVEAMVVPLDEMKETIRDYLIPLYAERWLAAGAKTGWTEENPQFIVKNVYEYYRQSGDLSIFEEKQEDIDRYLSGNICYFEAENGLVRFADEDVFSDAFRKRGYGFYDTVQKSGYILCASLLYWEAYCQIAEMYGALQRRDRADHYLKKAERIQRAIAPVFWNERDQLLLAATDRNRQSDVWMSAYAVCAGILDEATADRISQALARHYGRVVWKGQVRQMLEPEGWQWVVEEHRRVNRYQNGGYWGTASGWVFRALRRSNPGLAETMMKALIADYRERGAYEWVYPDGCANCLHYVASVGIPLRALIDEGYLPRAVAPLREVTP